MSQTTENESLRLSIEPLRRSTLFQENPAYEELLTHFLSNEGVQERNLPEAPNLLPIHAGICLPGMDVFTEENRTWHGLFRMDSTVKTSGIPAQIMYPPGTRIDTAIQVYYDGCYEFVVRTSAVLLKRDQADSLPLLQIKQSLENAFREKAGAASSEKIAFASPAQWFESLDRFTYGIIKVTLPDKRPYKERTRARLQAALDKMEGTAFDKISYLQQELKVKDVFRLYPSVRDNYQNACVKLREYKRQVYAFTHNMDLDDPEQVYAFARRGEIIKRFQMKVDLRKWILDRTPDAEKCFNRPVNIRKNGTIGIWCEDPIHGVLCSVLPFPGDKKIYFKPSAPPYPKIAPVQNDLKEVHVTIRGGDLISLKL